METKNEKESKMSNGKGRSAVSFPERAPFGQIHEAAEQRTRVGGCPLVEGRHEMLTRTGMFSFSGCANPCFTSQQRVAQAR